MPDAHPGARPWSGGPNAAASIPDVWRSHETSEHREAEEQAFRMELHEEMLAPRPDT